MNLPNAAAILRNWERMWSVFPPTASKNCPNSREACRDKFAVARATPEIIKAYDVKMPAIDMTNRTSFVIAQDGRIAFIHSDLDYQDHVRLTYEAVRKLKESGTPTT